jgi:hypothetical protein
MSREAGADEVEVDQRQPERTCPQLQTIPSFLSRQTILVLQ